MLLSSLGIALSIVFAPDQMSAVRHVCGELVLKPRQADGKGLGSDFASGKNLDLQPWVVSS